jgi:glycosyltransferase involved in cell wall biosynthesis
VKVYTHNFNPNSNSGPNKFTRTLFNYLTKHNKVILTDQHEADIEFCLIQQQEQKVKPMVLRLDGIWFNSDQNYVVQNMPIKYAYQNADAVIFQSEFNKKLTEKWFGEHNNSHVIHNAADLGLIKSANRSYWNKKFGKDREVWSCASSWRPHKRLKDNIRYFLEKAPNDAVLAVAGLSTYPENINHKDNERIVFLGELDYMSLLSLYKRSSTFIHLAYLDHCPNVVVDAQAAGCKIICSNSGGTHEIVSNGIMINEETWNFEPIKLYQPPYMRWNETEIKKEQTGKEKPSIVKCSKKYLKIMKDLL